MRKRFKHKIATPQMTLNITSMTDMFTILLVFLLQNYTASQVEIDPIEGLRLPSSVSEKNPVDGVKIGVSTTELRVDKDKLLDLQSSAFKPTDIDSHDTNFLPGLFNHLQELNKKNPKLAETGKVLLQADKELSYNTLRKVMYTASMAGFPNIKMVVQVGK